MGSHAVAGICIRTVRCHSRRRSISLECQNVAVGVVRDVLLGKGIAAGLAPLGHPAGPVVSHAEGKGSRCALTGSHRLHQTAVLIEQILAEDCGTGRCNRPLPLAPALCRVGPDSLHPVARGDAFQASQLVVAVADSAGNRGTAGGRAADSCRFCQQPAATVISADSGLDQRTG